MISEFFINLSGNIYHFSPFRVALFDACPQSLPVRSRGFLR
jgi:hypothetical protein